MSTNGVRSSLADPSRLKPIVEDDDNDEIIKVVIETPTLKKVLPAGMTFPYDFGFVPSTKVEDGDPTDVLVLMDEPAFPGCVLKCRRNIKGRPFWSRVWVLASIPTERNALNG